MKLNEGDPLFFLKEKLPMYQVEQLLTICLSCYPEAVSVVEEYKKEVYQNTHQFFTQIRTDVSSSSNLMSMSPIPEVVESVIRSYLG